MPAFHPSNKRFLLSKWCCWSKAIFKQYYSVSSFWVKLKVQTVWRTGMLVSAMARLFNNSSEFLIFTNMYPNHDTKGQNRPIKHTIIRGHHGFSVNNCSVIFIGLHTVWLLIILCGWGCLLKSIIISFVLIKWRWDSSHHFTKRLCHVWFNCRGAD